MYHGDILKSRLLIRYCKNADLQGRLHRKRELSGLFLNIYNYKNNYSAEHRKH